MLKSTWTLKHIKQFDILLSILQKNFYEILIGFEKSYKNLLEINIKEM